MPIEPHAARGMELEEYMKKSVWGAGLPQYGGSREPRIKFIFASNSEDISLSHWLGVLKPPPRKMRIPVFFLSENEST